MVRKEQVSYQRSSAERRNRPDTSFSNNKSDDSNKEYANTSLIERNTSDAYQKCLLKLINEIEDIYRLNTIADTNTREEIRDLPITQLNDYLIGIVPSLSAIAKRERNIKVSGVMAAVQYLSFNIMIKEEERVLFDDHPALPTLVKSVSYFTNGKQFLYDRDFEKNLISMLTILEKYEEKSFMRINIKLSYKLLRLIYLLLLYGNKIDAAIVATFVNDQARKSLERIQKGYYNHVPFYAKHANKIKDIISDTEDKEQKKKEQYERYVERQNREYNSRHSNSQGGNIRNDRQNAKPNTRRKRVNTTARKRT